MPKARRFTCARARAVAVAVGLAGAVCKADTVVDARADLLQLEKYHWRLSEATSRAGERLPVFAPPNAQPLTLEFHGDFLDADGCNHLSERLSLSGHRLAQSRSESDLVTRTLLGCDDRLALRDDAVLILLNGDPRYRLIASERSVDAPALELESDAGIKVLFRGVPTARTRFGEEGQVISFDIAPNTVRCNRPQLPPRDCLQVRQLLDAQNLGSYFPGDDWIDPARAGSWQLLYESINGLTVDNTRGIYMFVRRFRRPEAAAGAAAFVYLPINE